MPEPRLHPVFLSLSDLRSIAPTTTYDEHRRHESIRQSREEAILRLALYRAGREPRAFFGGDAPEFRGISKTSIAVNESDILVEGRP